MSADNPTPQPGYRIRAVLFDFDGTLTAPGAIDFEALRRQLDCPAGTPLLEYIDSLPQAAARRQALDILDQHEYQAAAISRPHQDAVVLLEWLHARNIRMGIITRNSLRSLARALENFPTGISSLFSIQITRDNEVPPKPDPAGVLLAAAQWNLDVSELLVVGDYHFDIIAGDRAGALTAFLDNATGYRLRETTSHFSVSGLSQLIPVIEQGLPLKPGKLPLELLHKCLEEIVFDDPSVLINPGIGEDIAAVDIAAEDLLVLKSDPITFATDAIGHYAVLVNANDIATSGARPRWLLTTLLFPVGATPSQIIEVMRGLQQACRQWQITLCGGHTEITDAVTRPIVSGMMCGTVHRRNLIDKRHIQPGDRLWLTKALAVEGTSIIAREFGARLRAMGISEATLAACRDLLDQISILPEAGLAAEIPGVSGMHDVTEGGLAGALEELSVACGHHLRVNLETIPIMDTTRQICQRLGINPLGLIGSGSLLICCRAAGCHVLEKTILQTGIAICCIGEVMQSTGASVEALEHGRTAVWPRFDVDEITRLFGDIG